MKTKDTAKLEKLEREVRQFKRDNLFLKKKNDVLERENKSLKIDNEMLNAKLDRMDKYQ